MGNLEIWYEHACENTLSIMLKMTNWNWKLKKNALYIHHQIKEGEPLMVSNMCVQKKCISPHIIAWENFVMLVIWRIGSSHFSRKMNDKNLILIKKVGT
jgi:hypothetical protein